MLGVADYGYYFYIALNVVEAQHAGIMAASQTTVNDCTLSANSAAKANAITNAENAESAYLTAAGLSSTVTIVGTTGDPVCQCPDATTVTCWQISLSVDFRPIIGRVMPWMKSVTPGKARFTAHKMVVNGL